MSEFKIKIYTLPNCVQCNQTKKTFDKAGVEYETVDAKESEDAYIFITKSLGYTSAPVVTVTAPNEGVIEHWSGFQPEKIKKYIGDK